MDSVIHILNKWRLKSNLTRYISNTVVPEVAKKENILKEFSRLWKIVLELYTIWLPDDKTDFTNLSAVPVPKIRPSG